MNLVDNAYINEREIHLSSNFDSMEFENSLTKGVDKFESGVAKARDKIDSIGEQTKEQYENWKRVLSGALNDKQLVIALAVLFGFYLFFSGFNTILGGNAREENTITCACPTGHSVYYRTLLAVTVTAWVVCFVLTMIWDTVKFWRYAVGKRASLRHQTWASADIENAKDHASSMLEQTIGSVEEGAQAARKIPVKSIFTKAMGIVEDTLDMVDEGAKALHKIDSGLKEVRENPLESVLNKSMEVVDDVVTHRLESTDENTAKVSEPSKLSATSDSLLKKATEIVSIAKQDPTLAKVVNPLDEKAQELKHSSVGSMLTKSAELVEDGMQTINQNPAELMVSRAMDFVDDKAQINSAELIGKSKELVDQVKDNPTDSLVTRSVNMMGNAVLNDNLEGPNAMQSVYPTGQLQTPEVMHDATSICTSSMVSTAMGMVSTGLQTFKQDPEELALSKTMEFAADKAAHRNPTIAKTVGLLATAASSDDPANCLMQDAMEMAEQNPTVTETMASLNNGSLAYGGSLLSTATGMVDSGIPENTTVTTAIGFAEDDDDINQMPTKSAAGFATKVLLNQCPTESQTAVQTNARSVLTDAVKVARKPPKAKKSCSKKSLLHSRQLTAADTNALLRLKHYEDYLWLQFYKVYSVGATLQGDDQVLPAFIHVVGSDHKEPDGYETSADDEIKPLIEQTTPAYPETELVEVQSSYDDGDGDEIPAIVIEPDFSDENHDREEGHNTDEVPTVIIKSNMSGKICDTISDCYDTEGNYDSTAVKNDDRTTYNHDVNLRATNQDDKNLTLDLTPAMDHPLASAKLTQSDTSLLSVKSNSCQPNSTQSTTSLLSVKSNSTDKEEDLLASWISLKPVGLYNESVDEENVVMLIADATCARFSFFLYPMLVLTRLLSQLVLVPLLLFQIMDTYAWICMTGDVYCSTILNQYRLGLDKAALAFTFYCCLLASI